jgi:hypothetical protein
MMQQSRRQLLIKAVQDAAIELAAKANRERYAPALPDNKKPTPDEISAAATAHESATGATYLDNTDEDELWAAYAINADSSRQYAGVGRTAAEAKAMAWINSHWPGGTTPASVKVSTKVPDGWTFELYPPPKQKPEMLAISALAILRLVRRTIPDVTLDEINDTIMQSLPYMGGRRQ